MRQVTIKDIAKIAGVSCSTVSRALNGSKELSEQTRSRILDICNEQGYRANAMARGLINGRTNVLGVIVPDVTNPFYSELSLGIEKHAHELGYNVILCNSLHDAGRAKEIFEFLLSHCVDGIILASSNNDSPAWIRDYSSNVPSVLLGSAAAESGIEVNSVGIDNNLGGIMAAEYLLSLGHRDILCLGYRPSSVTHRLRFKGFAEKLKQEGAKLSVIQNTREFSSTSYGYDLSRDLFSKALDCTAIFAMTDSMALGVMQGADEHGLSIPGDVSLLGFDNILYSSLPRINISTIDQRKDLLSQCAVDLLIGTIGTSNPDVYTQRLIRPVLIERSTCRKL